MNQPKLIFVLPVIVLCLAIIFALGFEKARREKAEVEKIHRTAEAAMEAYLKGQRITGIFYNSLPIQYDKGRCIIGCQVDSAGQSGVKRRTEFEIILKREKKTWQAAIVTVEERKR